MVTVLSGSPCAATLPTDGLVLHLDASSLTQAGEVAGGNVFRWEDLSGRGHHVAQDSVARQPAFAVDGQNGLPVVRFAGKAFLDGPAALKEGTKELTFIAVWKKADAGTVGAICEQAGPGIGRRASLLAVNDKYGFNGQNNDQHALLRYRPGQFTISILTLDGTGTVRLWHNDNTGGTGARGFISHKKHNLGTKAFRVGAKIEGGGERLNGDIAEILVYDRVIAFDDVKLLNEALGAKWGIGKEDQNGKRRVYTMPEEEINREPDYTSKVPQFTFSNTLEEQKKELTSNPLLARFAVSRKEILKDPHHPLYHFVSPENRLNDPNGLCFWNGQWHMFYQGYPPEDPRQHWGHAISDDLIHWRDLPYAIYPNPEDCCFSGSALVDGDRVIAMYHGTKVGSMVATSSDPLLLNWEKVTGKSVIPYAKPGEDRLPYNIFDPCIWKKDGVYYALTAGTLPEGPGGKPVRAEFLHRSADLATWEYLHPFLEDDQYGLVGDDGACPYFWPIGSRHILLHFSHMSGGKYLLGDYDKERDKFVVTYGSDFNFGPVSPCGVHAPSACPDGKGGVITIFNMNAGKGARGWNQIMSLPRLLTHLGGDDIGVEPAGDVESLRTDHKHVDSIQLPANEEIVLDGISGNAMEIVAEIDPRGAQMVEMDVLRSPGREEYTRIVFQKNRGYARRDAGRREKDSVVTIDTTYSSALPDAASRPPEIAPVNVGKDETLKLRVFLDRSIIEVFVNGKQCLGVRLYPGREDSLGVSLRAQGRNAVLKSLDAWQMTSIYGE